MGISCFEGSPEPEPFANEHALRGHRDTHHPPQQPHLQLGALEYLQSTALLSANALDTGRNPFFPDLRNFPDLEHSALLVQKGIEINTGGGRGGQVGCRTALPPRTNRRRHRLTEPTTKALCQPPPPPAQFRGEGGGGGTVTCISPGISIDCANFVRFRGLQPLLPHLCPLSVP